MPSFDKREFEEDRRRVAVDRIERDPYMQEMRNELLNGRKKGEFIGMGQSSGDP